MKRICARVILIEDEYIYLMYRHKFLNQKWITFYTYPGGGQEADESLEQTAVREVKEEFCVDIKLDGLLKKVEYEENITYYYKGTILSGIPKLGGEEAERSCKTNYYEVRKIPLSEVKNIDLYHKELIEMAKKC